MLIPKVLVGPLIAPEQIGAWLFHPQIRALADPRVFNPPPAWRGLVNQTQPETLPWQPYTYGESLRDILAKFAQGDDWQPEVILWWGFGYTVLPADLIEAPCPVVLIASDWQSCRSELWAWREAFDLILGDQALVNQFQARGFERCQWWPSYGFSPAQFYPDPQTEKYPEKHPEKNWDLTYIGSLNPDTHPERLRLLSQLAPLGNRYRICLRDQVYGAEYLQLLQQSRVVFNHSLRGEMNLRAYQAPAAGALLLQESDNLEIQRFLKPGSECLLYDPESVLADVSAILARSDLPHLAKAGQNAIQAHSYERQFETLWANLPNQLTRYQRKKDPLFVSESVNQHRQLRQSLHPALTAGKADWLKAAFLPPPDPALSAQKLPGNSLSNQVVACLSLSLAPATGPASEVEWRALQAAVEKAPEDPLLSHDLAWGAYLTGKSWAEVNHLADQALAQLTALPANWESPETAQVLPWVGALSFQLAWDAACFQGDPAQMRSLLGWNLWRLKAEAAWSERRLPASFEALEQALNYSGPPTLWLPFAQTAAALGLIETCWQALNTHLTSYPLDRNAAQWGLQWALASGQHEMAKLLLAQLEELNLILATSEAYHLALAALKQAL
jgi:hypothetical protein